MFSIDGGLYRMLTFLYRCMVMNLLYILFCIPVVTIPPATAGLFAVARKTVYGEDPSILRTFWGGFRENLKQSWIVSAVFAVAVWILWIDFRVFAAKHWAFSGLALIVLLLVGFFALSTFLHLFPLMVHLDQPTRSLFTNAVKLNFIKPYWSIVNVAAWIAWYFLAVRVVVVFPILFFSVGALFTYWAVDRKFRAVMAVKERVDKEEQAALSVEGDGVQQG